MGDAIGRTLFRLLVTRRHLLEWVPAAQATIGPRLDLSASIGAWPARLSSALRPGALRCLRGTGVVRQLAPGRGLRSALDRLAGDRPLGQPVAPGRGPAYRVRRRCAGFAADRASHLAVLRDFRHAGRPHAAAGQFSGGPGAGARASHVADQSRPLSAVGGHRARLRVDRNRRGGRAAGSDASHHGQSRRAFAAISTIGTTRRTCGRSIPNTSPRSTAAIWPAT